MPPTLNIDIFDNSSSNISPNEIKKLEAYERIIPILDTLYERGESCIHPDTGEVVSDAEYDRMRAFVKRLRPDSRIFKTVTASAIRAKKVVKHDPPMTSIDKANGALDERNKQLTKWLLDRSLLFNVTITNQLNETDPSKLGWAQSYFKDVNPLFVMSYKRDGVAIALYYENGKLVRAGLRPRDGVNGEDVTGHTKYIQGIPQQLALPLTCSIRGEVECRKSVFEKLNGSAAVDEQEFANPRNYTAGSLSQEDMSVLAKRGLSFVAYSIENLDNPPYKTARERAIWANKTLKIPFVRVEPFMYSMLLELEAKANELDYEVDGIIIEVNDLDLQEQAGRSGDRATGNPRGKIAWKFDDETADVVPYRISCETGRTGRITPVLEFKGVTLAGTVVSRCSAHSYGFLARNNIEVGTKLRIRKSGKIIPEVLGVYDDKGNFIEKIEAGDPNVAANFDAVAQSIAPSVCPSCGVSTKILPGNTKGMLDVVCESKTCPAQNVKTFIHYLQSFGVKGVADEVVTALVEAGKVKRFADFYELSVTDIKESGVSLRKSLLAVARIHMVHEPEKIKDDQQLARIVSDAVQKKKHIALDKLIACFGIPGASKGTGRDLASHFRSFSRILDACETDFSAVANVGEKTAKGLCDYFNKHRDDLRKLLDHIEIELPKDGKFSGKTFVFTGSMSVERRTLEDLVQQEGGKVASSVSKKTDYVVVGSDPGSKYDKAIELNRTILNEEQFFSLMDR